jgi:uncharacterized membrane protein YkvA (DUF1232 family)
LSLPSPEVTVNISDALLLIAALSLALYAGLFVVLLLLGRRDVARALGGFIPDCLVLLRRLLGDPRLSRRRKLVLGAAIAYLAMPIDLIPDFIPVAGQLDDAIIVGLALRGVIRGAGPALLDKHWPGPPESLAMLRRLA